MSSSSSESEDTQAQEKTNGKIPFDTPKNDLIAKYEKLKGKSLYLRFPSALPPSNDDLVKVVKRLCDKIVNIRSPRQKSRRWCLVDFANPEEKQEAIEVLKKVEVDGKKLKIQIPKTDDKEFVEKLLERRKKTAEKRAAKKLKKAAERREKLEKEKKSNPQKKIYTSTIIVKNIPKDASLSDVKEKFPNAIDISISLPKANQDSAVATITFPTPLAATKAKRENINSQIGENTLHILFSNTKDVSNPGKGKHKLKQNPPGSILLIKKQKANQSDQEYVDIDEGDAKNEELFPTKKSQKKKRKNKGIMQNTNINPTSEGIKKKKKQKPKVLKGLEFGKKMKTKIEKT